MPEHATRVLVVEDDRDFAESLVIALSTRNCEVEIARTGEDAIRLYHLHPSILPSWISSSPARTVCRALPKFSNLSPGADCHDDVQ